MPRAFIGTPPEKQYKNHKVSPTIMHFQIAKNKENVG